MKNSLLLISLILVQICSVFGQAPAISWAKKYGGAGADRCSDIAVDNQGNSYTTGYFTNTSIFGSYAITSTGGADVFLSKTDPGGNLLWVRSFGTGSGDAEAGGVSTDLTGNIFITGSYTGTATFGSTSLTAIGSATNIFVAKIDPSGNVLWAVGFSGVSAVNIPYDIACDPSGNAFFTGRYGNGSITFGSVTLNAPNGSDAFLAKIDGNGVIQWALRFGGTDTSTDYGYAVAADATGNCYASGTSYSSQPFFGSFSISGSGSKKAYTVKVSSSGAVQWVNGVDNAGAVEVGTDQDGNIYTIGDFLYTGNFGGYAAVSNGGADVFVTKANPAGTTLWVTSIGSTGTDLPISVAANTSGVNLLMNTGAAMQIISGVNAAAGNYVVSLDPSSGAAAWTKKFGDSDDYGRDIQVGPSGNVFYGGNLTNTAVFDTYSFTSSGTDDIFLIKLVGPCSTTSSTLNVSACSTYTLNGTTYSSTGTFQQTIVNAAGCDSVITLNLTIQDVTAPIANVTNLPVINSQCSVTTLTAPTATDNCAGTVTGTHNVTLPLTASTTITWTYDDGQGNTSSQTQSVVINDNTAPVADITNLPVLNAQCSITSLTAPTATDNCASTVTGTHNVILPLTASTTITWTYDDGHGNTSSQVQSVAINDNTAPVADIANLPVLNAQCSITSLTSPTATDNCAGTVTGTHNVTLPLTASTTITWTYDDGHGNTSSQTQNVVINDVTAPVPDLSTLPNVTAPCSITSLTAPTATDNCAGAVNGTPNVVFPITAQGSFTITWTFNDGHGNTSTQTQNITIDDNTAPLADNAILANIQSECSITSLTFPTATDNCIGTVTGTHDVTLPITASTTITWTYDDGHGNTSSQTQNVVINDITAPVADVTNLTALNAQCSITSLTAPTATDNCAGTITGIHNATLPITASTTIIWTYDDGHGNTSSQTQNVIISGLNNGINQINSNTLEANGTGYSYQWIDCNDGNSVISGATSQNFAASLDGNYAVIVSNGICSDTSDCMALIFLGLEENIDVKFQLYPNPSNSQIMVSSTVDFNKIEVMNSLGQLVDVYSFDQVQDFVLCLSGEEGLYFVKIYSDKFSTTRPVVKKN